MIFPEGYDRFVWVGWPEFKAAEFDPQWHEFIAAMGRAAMAANQPRDEDGKWTDTGAGSKVWTNKSAKTASEISGVKPEDAKLKTYKAYHVTKRENVEAILNKGFDPSKFKPQWQNDYALSLSKGLGPAAAYFSKQGQPLDTTKYAILEVKFTGRLQPNGSGNRVGYVSSPQAFAKAIVALGYDGQDIDRTIFVHNTQAIRSVREVQPKVRSAEFNPDQPRDEKGMWTDTGGGTAAVRDYVRGSGSGINYGLRGNPQGFDDDTWGVINQLDKKMAPIGEPSVLYRVSDPEKFEDLKVGDSFVDKAFVSTTRKESALDRIYQDAVLSSDHPVVFEMSVPASTPVIDINAVMGKHNYEYQEELLLARGLKFTVTKIEPIDLYGRAARKIHVTVREVQPKAPKAPKGKS